MKKILAAVFLAMFIFTGCTGSFNLTRKVYDFHRSQEDKWVDELLFLVLIIVPVYGIATFVDVVVTNSIEFWTGDNPVSASIDSSKTTDMSVARMENGELKIKTPDGTAISFERGLDGILAKDATGKVVMKASIQDDGRMNLYDADMKLVRSFSKESIQLVRNHYLQAQ